MTAFKCLFKIRATTDWWMEQLEAAGDGMNEGLSVVISDALPYGASPSQLYHGKLVQNRGNLLKLFIPAELLFKKPNMMQFISVMICSGIPCAVPGSKKGTKQFNKAKMMIVQQKYTKRRILFFLKVQNLAVNCDYVYPGEL